MCVCVGGGVWVSECVCVRACVRASVRACVRACMRACVCVWSVWVDVRGDDGKESVGPSQSVSDVSRVACVQCERRPADPQGGPGPAVELQPPGTGST